MIKNVAMLTAGGGAPGLASAVACLVERHSEIAPRVAMRGYSYGYLGLLTGQSQLLDPGTREAIVALHDHGGSPLGCSRVGLTSPDDALRFGAIEPGQDPLEVAVERLWRDRIDALYAIGGDGTQHQAAALRERARARGYELTVVGIPKTVDDDIAPIKKTMGAATAAEQGARFFENLVYEHAANPGTLIVHMLMGRYSGALAARTAHAYRQRLQERYVPTLLALERKRLDLDGVYLPELAFDLDREGARLRARIKEKGSVNVFVAEGVALGRVSAGARRTNDLNGGAWLAEELAPRIGARKVLVERSGYFARSAPANTEDRLLVRTLSACAVSAALRGESGVVGHDEERNGALGVVDFGRIRSGKPFKIEQVWFVALLDEIGQPGCRPVGPELVRAQQEARRLHDPVRAQGAA